jgi:hypothetical protein
MRRDTYGIREVRSKARRDVTELSVNALTLEPPLDQLPSDLRRENSFQGREAISRRLQVGGAEPFREATIGL